MSEIRDNIFFGLAGFMIASAIMPNFICPTMVKRMEQTAYKIERITCEACPETFDCTQAQMYALCVQRGTLGIEGRFVGETVGDLMQFCQENYLDQGGSDE